MEHCGNLITYMRLKGVVPSTRKIVRDFASAVVMLRFTCDRGCGAAARPEIRVLVASLPRGAARHLQIATTPSLASIRSIACSIELPDVSIHVPLPPGGWPDRSPANGLGQGRNCCFAKSRALFNLSSMYSRNERWRTTPGTRFAKNHVSHSPSGLTTRGSTARPRCRPPRLFAGTTTGTRV